MGSNERLKAIIKQASKDKERHGFYASVNSNKDKQPHGKPVLGQERKKK